MCRRFYVPLSDSRVKNGEADFRPFLWEPPLESVRAKAEAASSIALAYQVEVIEAALGRKPRQLTSPLQSEIYNEIARQLCREILAKAKIENDAPLWDRPVFQTNYPSAWESGGLYSGDLGVLAAIAGFDYTNGSELAGPLSERLLCRLAGHCSWESLGIGSGLGSLIYGALLIGALTGSVGWHAVARQTALQIPDSAILGEAKTDLVSGIAGLLVAFTRLYQITGDDEVLQKGAVCVENLAQRFRSGAGWIGPAGEVSPGFAHGAAGIAFAAGLYAKAAGNSTAWKVAQDALEVNRRCYSPKHRNWPIDGASLNPRFLSTWCHGLPGILLSRLASPQLYTDAELTAEVERCLTDFPAELPIDHWCCGNLGLVEILLYAGYRLSRPDLEAAVSGLAGRVFIRAARCCFYRFSSRIAENYCFQPGLFRGMAGVLYSALRLAHPGRLPCLVAFELPDGIVSTRFR